MSRANPFISNGTCYHSAGEKVDEWLPCGNAELGDKTCCQRGDLCLSSRACYNGRFGITYLAGCSDPEYAHESCPDKGPWSDQPWSGLVYCNGTSNEWVGCEQAARPTTLTSADACWCPQTSRTVAFADASVLENVVQLPTALGSSVIWQPGHVPSLIQPDTTPTSTPPIPPATSPTPGDTSVASPTVVQPPTSPPSLAQPTDTAAAQSSSSGGMSSSAIGAIIGAVLGGSVVIFLLGWFIRRRCQDNRRREQQQLSGDEEKKKPKMPSEVAAFPWAGMPSAAELQAGSRGAVNLQWQREVFDDSNRGVSGVDRKPKTPMAELPG